MWFVCSANDDEDSVAAVLAAHHVPPCLHLVAKEPTPETPENNVFNLIVFFDKLIYKNFFFIILFKFYRTSTGLDIGISLFSNTKRLMNE